MFDGLSEHVKQSVLPYHSRGTLADGSAVLFPGQIQLSVRLRSETALVNLVVTDIHPDAILGMPFFKDEACQLQFSDSTLIMTGKTLRCTDKTGIDLSRKVQVINAARILPCSEQLVECRLIHPTW